MGSPKWRKRPPLQVPIAARPGSLIALLRSGLGVAGAAGALALRRALAVVVLLRADADLLAPGLFDGFRLRLLRGDDLEAEGFVLLVAALVAGDHHGRAGGHLALAQDFVGQRVLDVALDRATKGTSTHRGIPAFVDQQFLRL